MRLFRHSATCPLFRKYDCPLFKIDVKFHATGRPEQNPDGRQSFVESDEDIITSLSRPYLASPVYD